MPRSINQAGADLIKRWEGFREYPYQDVGGVWTIGYGTTRGVTQFTPPVSPERAAVLLCKDLVDFEQAIEDNIESDLTDNQFSALVCLIYNVGTLPLSMSLGKYLNEEEYEKAADEFLKWNHVGGKVVKGLTNRRIAERELFLTIGD